MWVCNDAYLFRINAQYVCVPWNAEEPTPKCHRQGIKDRGFPGGVFSNQQIELRVEIEFAMIKAVEVFNRQMVDSHYRASLFAIR